MKKILLVITMVISTQLYIDAQMNGKYTICADGSCDFLTISQAFDSLASQGVNGPVDLQLADTLFSEQITTSFIGGTSAINVVTLSTNTDSTNGLPAKIQFTATDAGDNFIITLDSIQYLTIKQIKLTPLNPTFATGIIMQNGCKNITIDSTEITSALVNLNSVIYINDPGADSIAILNSVISNGGTAIIAKGQVGKDISNLRIINNQFINNTLGGILYSKGFHPVINENTFLSDYIRDSYKAISYNNVWNYTIEQNYFYLKNATAISLGYSGGNYENRLVNNIVFVKGEANPVIDIGIEIKNGSYQDIYNNTVVMGDSCSVDSRACSFTSASGSGTNNSLLNNNLVNLGKGYSFFIEDDDPNPIDTCDYNNLYSTGVNFGYYLGNDYDSLAVWNDSTGYDVHSLTIDPLFADTTYTISCAAGLDTTGFPVKVPVDFNNVERNMLKPSIGASEIITIDISLDLAKEPADVCPGESTTISGPVSEDVSYLWSTGSDQNEITVTDDGWYTLTISNTCFSMSDSVEVIYRVDCVDGVQDINLSEESIDIYSSFHQLYLQTESDATKSVVVTSVDGKTMYRNSFRERTATINTTDWPEGIYLVSMLMDNKMYNRKIIIR